LKPLTEAARNLGQAVLKAYEGYRAERGIRGLSDADRTSYARHADIVLLDLFSAYDGDSTKYVGYSRGKANFVKGGCYWDTTRNQAILSERIFVGLIDFLADSGFVENHIAKAGYGAYSSRMRATEKLAELFRLHNVTGAHIGADLDAPVIFVRDENKKLIPLPEPDGFDLEAAQRNLRRINANLQSTFINLDVPDATLEELIRRKATDEAERDEPSEPFEFTNRTLRRIFALGGYENGGRFYGGWWQSVPGDYRKFIEIDGAMTREMDFTSIQPSIMYAEAGAEREGDTYIPPGWPDEVRPFGKKAFNQMINSDPSSAHENQWHRFAPDIAIENAPQIVPAMPKKLRARLRAIIDQRKRDAFEERFGSPYHQLLLDLLAMHGSISSFFFSKAWGRMQRLDSDIAERVMINLLDADVPITALPIHDSFIVRRGAENRLLHAMHEAFEEVVGVECDVELSEAVYDPPEGYEPKLVPIEALREDVQQWMVDSRRYHVREYEWTFVHGPID